MTTSALVYRPASKCSIVNAFAAAVAIHLFAIALAGHRAPAFSASTVFEIPEITGTETAVPLPPEPETETSLPPPPTLVNTDFIEPYPPLLPKAKPSARPIRPPRSVKRLAGISNPRALALSAPRPDYPYEARSRHITGSGVVTLRVDAASGTVLEASMEQGIGSPILDQSALSALRRWRFKMGTPPRVRVPITFTMMGAQF
jgi:TonB family protein